MDWANSEWMPWYKPDTAGWLELSLGARGAMAEVARKLDKRGELHLGRRGLPSLATLLRVQWSGELEPAITELIKDDRLAWDHERGVLSDPEFLSRLRPTSTARVLAHRERSRNAGNVTPVSVTQRRVDERRVDESRSEKKEREPRARKPTLAGTPLPEDWTLSPALLAWAKGKGVTEHDVRTTAERFVRHWHTSTKDNAIKRSWDKAFQSWLDKDIADGKVVAGMLWPTASVPVVALTPEQIERRERGRAMTAAAIAEMDKAVGQ
jgi:hypothetical protein